MVDMSSSSSVATTLTTTSPHREIECPARCSALEDADGGVRDDMSDDEEALHADFISRIDLGRLHELALSARHAASSLLDEVTCGIETPPNYGSFNLVYKVTFSDDIVWAIRVPVQDDVDTPTFRQSMRHDVISQQYIASRTSIPIPRIHDWSNTCDNLISRPYTIYDYVHGTQLVYLWSDRTWITDEKRHRILCQLARFSVELASLEFDKIGRLDFDDESQTYKVAPFPELGSFFMPVNATDIARPGPAGPFYSGVELTMRILHMRRTVRNSPTLMALQMFLPLLTDMSLDGPPFNLSHPNLDSQNVLVDDDGTIVALIDWDDVSVVPRQLGGAVYPSWLTVDWDPMYYGWAKARTPEENSRFDSPEDLIRYREEFLHEIDSLCGGRYTEVARNSHIAQSLFVGIANEASTAYVFARLSELVFGGFLLGFDCTEAIATGPLSSAAPGTTIEILQEDDFSKPVT